MVDGRVPGRRLYDYRGDEEDIRAAAVRLVLAAQESTELTTRFLVGIDGSEASAQISAELGRIADCNIQELTSPAVYRLSRGYTLGLAITASHDARPGISGLKVAQDGIPWVTDDYDAVDEGGTMLQPLRAVGINLDDKDERHAYRRLITAGAGGFFIRHPRKLEIWGGSDVATQLAYEVLSDLGLDCSATTIEGLDPSQPLDLDDVSDAVLIDADGDRLGLIWNGTWRSPTEIAIADIGAIAQIYGSQAGALLVDLRAPQSLLAAARAHGFKVDFSPGGRWMNLAVSTPAYVYGAETSGHRYWQAFSGSDCAVFGALKTLSTYIASDPPDALAEMEDLTESVRGLSEMRSDEARRRVPEAWLTYTLPDGLGWRCDDPAEERSWICSRLASDGDYALTANGMGTELLR